MREEKEFFTPKAKKKIDLSLPCYVAINTVRNIIAYSVCLKIRKYFTISRPYNGIFIKLESENLTVK
jgi:hypothetical protein